MFNVFTINVHIMASFLNYSFINDSGSCAIIFMLRHVLKLCLIWLSLLLLLLLLCLLWLSSFMFPFKVCSGTTTNLEEEHKPWLLHIVSFVGSAVLVDVVALGTSVGRPHDAHTAMLPKNPTNTK